MKGKKHAAVPAFRTVCHGGTLKQPDFSDPRASFVKSPGKKKPGAPDAAAKVMHGGPSVDLT